VKFFLRTFGCRVNQYETQRLRERLAGPGDAVTEGYEDADVCVVNTCTVTDGADRDALRLIGAISRRNPAARLVVTGCLASRDPRVIALAAPSAIIAGNAGKDDVPALLGCSPASGSAGISSFSGKSRAFVKVQDGCNMHCAFCVIPSVRPSLSCTPYPALEAEVRGLLDAGYAEIVLCGIRLGRYLSTDRKGKRVDLPGAIERLAALPGDFRIRLSSLEITDATDRLCHLFADLGDRLAPSLHLPLQSGSEGVLKRMRRWYSAGFYARRAAAAKAIVPNLAVFADVMAGFPGETAAEHEESLAFVRRTGFRGLHVFRYSRRPGTEAARLRSLPDSTVTARARDYRALDADLRKAFAAESVGAVRTVVQELSGSEGLTEDFLTVRLPGPVGPGLRRVRVSRSEDLRAYAEPEPKDPGGQDGGPLNSSFTGRSAPGR
jgi:threonylcarbamoyladenosine tRNA methylthiotransferase MtaB